MKKVLNEKGILTLDFLFAFIMIFGFVGVLFSFAMTFSVVESLQYISFASARNYSLAHLNQSKQNERANKKYNDLIQSNAMKAMLSGGWFEVSKSNNYDYNDLYNPDPSMESDIFIGVRLPLKAPILYKRIPLLGATASDPESFKVNIQSFLAREPSFEECKAFVEQRAEQLRNSGFNFDVNSSHNSIMDNGC